MKAVKLVAMTLAGLLAASPTLAGGSRTEPFVPIDAQAIIDTCGHGVDLKDQAIALEIRLQQVYRLDDCYRSAIHRLTEPMFDPDLFSQRDVQRLLIQMHNPTTQFYAFIFAGHRKCGCGPAAEIDYRLATAKRYEGFLWAIEEVRNLYSR